MSKSTTSLAENLQQVMARIRAAEQRFDREAGSVALLAVSKTFPADVLRELALLGVDQFGENYLQEALDKQKQLADVPICWHFIGPLQSNKSRAVAEQFTWLHSLDRLKLASRLSQQRPSDLVPLNICLQVNVSGESSKSGITIAEAPALAEQVAELPGLRLRGVMAIPATSQNCDEQRRAFAKVRECYQQLIDNGHRLDTLSMGMSGDLEAAVAEGATIVRIGSALFGARNYQ